MKNCYYMLHLMYISNLLQPTNICSIALLFYICCSFASNKTFAMDNPIKS